MSVALYNKLTSNRTRFVRVDQLCRLAIKEGQLQDPTPDEALPLKEKEGLERAQGEFLAEILADEACGLHLCHSMLLPNASSTQQMLFREKGELSFPGATLRREGKAAVVTMTNPAYLNAEEIGRASCRERVSLNV